ncbi:MAG: hydroxylamine reductase, partial [Candidatus Hydrogenedentes bacterium]|nr:hydroxylamine reductase [Candidatus Hydrogenedentota bacterium]
MFCYHCEQTAKGEGCAVRGVCGKSPEVSDLQDLLTFALRGLAQVALAGRAVGVNDDAVNALASEALFSTLTNVNFDDAAVVSYIRQVAAARDALKKRVAAAGGAADFGAGPVAFVPSDNDGVLLGQAAGVGLMADPNVNPDIRSLQHILLFGVRGVAAYGFHARLLGQTDDAVDAFIAKALAAPVEGEKDLNTWLSLVLECGAANLRAMELLDAGHTETYGHPVPTGVSLGAKKGKAILVSGHDLMDLKALLEQTQGKGINIYTHGEMLPANAYPELKKYPHLAGHYGTAWQNQAREFAAFPGAILMTTNCIQKPTDVYKENIFTAGPVGWPGVQHIAGRDFAPVIERALALPGFAEDVAGKTVLTGFARNAVLGVADKVIAGVKAGAIKHFFLVGGCDGAKPGRDYYTQFVEQVPNDCVILTLACGKFRFFDKELGDIGGIPR